MKSYHIIFLHSKRDIVCTGRTYFIEDEISALKLFRQEFPDAILLCMSTQEANNYKY